MKNLNKNVLKFLFSDYFKIFLIIGISFGISYFLFGNNLKSKWWAIDDHEIMLFLGDDGKLDLIEIPQTLIEKTEVGNYGEYERFRPSYYTLRLIETSLWGLDPVKWYFARICILTVFLSVLWYILWKQIDFIKGFIFLIIVLSANYWVELFSRLGPGETYCALGLAIYLLGYYNYFRIFHAKKTSEIFKNTNLILIIIGGIIAIGSKENFVILIIPTLFLLLFALIKKKLDWKLIVGSLVIIIYTFFILSAIFIALRKSGVDVYNNSIDMRSILFTSLEQIPRLIISLKIVDLIIGLSLFSFIVYRIKGSIALKQYYKIFGILLIFVFSALLLYISQHFFYRGNWPTNMRYDFPGLLYLPILLWGVMIFLRRASDILGIEKHQTENVLSLLFILFFIYLSPWGYIQNIQAYVNANVDRTNSWSNNVSSIVEVAKINPNAKIFFETYSVWDYEPMGSMNRFLKANGIKNDIYINIHDYPVSPGLEEKLRNEVLSISQSGGYLATDFFVERDDLVKKEIGHCISIHFSGSTEDECIQFRVW